MFRKIAISAVSALALTTGVAFASGAETHTEDLAFSFEGPFGTFDEHQLQRGLQVYTEVCAACHGMKFVPIRSLSDEGGPHLPEDQVRAYAATMDITDPETGEDRPRLPTDFFPTVTGEGMGERGFAAGIEAWLHHKEFGLVLEAARKSGVPVPLTAAVAQQLNALMAQGWGRDDTASLLRVLELS